MNPSPALDFPQSQTNIGYAYTLGTLIFVAGVPPQRLAEYLIGFNSQTMNEFSVLEGDFPPEVNPVVTTLIILLGPALNLISSSILSKLSQLIARFTFLVNIEIRIHESVWSRRLVGRLPIIPPSVKRAIVLVSNLLLDGPERVRVTYDANASPFTTSLTTALCGLHLTMKGHNLDLSFVFAVHNVLAAVDFPELCKAEIEISHKRSIYLRVSGSMRDARNVIRPIMVVAHIPEFARRQYFLKSFIVDASKLHHQDEFRHCMLSVLSEAPRLQVLGINIGTVNASETYKWMDSVRVLGGFRELVHIKITHPRPLNLSDADVAYLLRSWRHAEHVSLNPRASGSLIAHSQVLLTINALKVAAYQAPPSLRHLGLFVNADEVSVRGFRDIPPHYSAEKIELRLVTASAHRARAVTRLVEALFPSARVLEV
ncbi:hypothetical protein GGU10DRAFT_151151 [Lentinula aff. detonsa]|uniref:Uncharacterized protein n=1 Tax=Lentinula aff. detonsa TaxID=2804958 RepID=A0AA38KFV3_9AGAR|nr:hypothetical protein GGU10DRAFT_151151 [Lentinula aff. detonsa]